MKIRIGKFLIKLGKHITGSNKNKHGYMIVAIHQGGESDYICARTIVEALKELSSTTDIQLSDLETSDRIEIIPRDKWKEYKITDPERDHATIMTFDEYMSTAKTTELFCSTAY